jgi:AcrR family transcriptional regulator
MSSATVHRLIGSKDELLETVMETFSTNGAAGWRAVLDAEASTVEKLDALLWVHISLLADFSNEFRIGLAWTLESRGDAGLRFQGSFHPRLKDLTSLLASGIESGEMRSATGPIKLQARCLLELTWPPEEYAREDARGAHLFARDTVLRGAAARQPAT